MDILIWLIRESKSKLRRDITQNKHADKHLLFLLFRIHINKKS